MGIHINISRKMISSENKEGDQVIYTEIFVFFTSVVWVIELSRRSWTFGSGWKVFKSDVQLWSSPKLNITILHYMYLFVKKTDLKNTPLFTKSISENFVCFSFSTSILLFMRYSILYRLVSPTSRVFLNNLCHLHAWDHGRMSFQNCTFNLCEISIYLTFSFVECFLIILCATSLSDFMFSFYA